MITPVTDRVNHLETRMNYVDECTEKDRQTLAQFNHKQYKLEQNLKTETDKHSKTIKREDNQISTQKRSLTELIPTPGSSTFYFIRFNISTPTVIQNNSRELFYKYHEHLVKVKDRFKNDNYVMLLS